MTSGAGIGHEAPIRSRRLARRGGSRQSQAERSRGRAVVEFPAYGHGSIYVPPSPAASSCTGALKAEFEMADGGGKRAPGRRGLRRDGADAVPLKGALSRRCRDTPGSARQERWAGE